MKNEKLFNVIIIVITLVNGLIDLLGSILMS